MKLVFLLEEQSMKTFLDGILPRILPPDVTFITVPHEGKTDLQKSIPIKAQSACPTFRKSTRRRTSSA